MILTKRTWQLRIFLAALTCYITAENNRNLNIVFFFLCGNISLYLQKLNIMQTNNISVVVVYHSSDTDKTVRAK